LKYFYVGEPYFEKHKSYPHYHRSSKQRLRRYKNKTSSRNFSSKSSYANPSINNLFNDFTHKNNNHHHVKRRAKRQFDFDPMAKHVEVLVAYDQSIKEFHSDADIKSYILTLFSYVSFFFFSS
jgi:hypothetical protein